MYGPPSMMQPNNSPDYGRGTGEEAEIVIPGAGAPDRDPLLPPAQPSYNSSSSGAAAAGDGKPQTTLAAYTNLGLKLLFYACIICQVILWPSPMTIAFAGALALEGLLVFFFSGSTSAGNSLTEYAVLLLHGRKVSTSKYIAMCIIAAYMLVFFLLFAAHEAQVLPVQTTWIHPTLVGKYGFDADAGRNKDFTGVDVSDDVAKTMRRWPYQWPRELQAGAVAINTTIAQGFGSAGSLNCATPGAFECYSAKLAVASGVPDDATLFAADKRFFVPMVSDFYTADAIVTPPAGMACSSLEVYRITLDADKNIEHGLDYPAATAASADVSTPFRKCNLFGMGAGWCLQSLHGFSDRDYVGQVGAKCALNDNRWLTIRLPPRASSDVSPVTGRVGHDLLVVSTGATVEMRWKWHAAGEQVPLLSAWDQTESSRTDQSQPWRDSADPVVVFIKYAIAIIPLLMLWYFLATTFKHVVESYQILMTCVFVLLPAVLFFVSIGAWLPLVSCIICTLAINHAPATHASPGAWAPTLRHALLFLTAVCNSIQLIWLLVLIAQSGWFAFLYDGSLRQLTATSSDFIISGQPTWIGLMLPIALLINATFLIGAAICVALELLAAYSGGGKRVAPV